MMVSREEQLLTDILQARHGASLKNPNDMLRHVQDAIDTSGLPKSTVKNVVAKAIQKATATLSESEKELRETEAELIRVRKEKDAVTSIQQPELSGAMRIQKFRDAFPGIWDSIALRTYKHTDAYGNYRLAYLEWAWGLAMMNWHLDGKARIEEDEKGIKMLEACNDVIATFALHKEHNFPFFFVSKGICDAAWQSDLKFDVEWRTMHLPFESFTFVLPNGNPVGYEAIIVHRRVSAGEIKLTLSALKSDNSFGYEIKADYPFNPNKDADSHTLRWVFNTIFAMSARPEYVEGGERLGAKKGTSKAELWSPNVIGRKYAVKSHTFAKEASSSRRLHWRRGHFRQQAYGVGRGLHRVIWIEPMMIGGRAVP